MKRAVFFLFLTALFFPPHARAFYSDEISASPDEVWRGVEKAMKPYGIRKSDFKKRRSESDWKEDQYVKSGKGLLHSIGSSVVRRRYRFQVRLEENSFKTLVKIKGSFQEKPLDVPPGILWKPVKPDTDDLELERNFFMKILAELESLRRVSVRN